jgi:flavorubredoxin
MTHALETLKGAGYKTKVFRFTDEEQASLSEILGEIPDSEAIILGVSTYEAGAFPMMNFLATQIAHKTDYRKPVLIISSYGWGSAAVREMSSALEKTKLEVKAVVEYRGLAGTESLDRLDEALKELLK